VPRGIPAHVDLTRWCPAVDRKGVPVKPGDRVSVRKYPRGTVRGELRLSTRAWCVVGGEEIGQLVVVAEDGSTYTASDSILKINRPF
jgi:hypothetical protein